MDEREEGDDYLLLATGAAYLFLLTMSQVAAVRLLNISPPFMVPGGVISYSASVAMLDIASVKFGARSVGGWSSRPPQCRWLTSCSST